ncbi:endo alpha-1,4 polygalactosaminidase [Flavobacterium myungsuense]|uniref:endo alpha-1,4 polygalactosaminidase n=1 Tax=Flavobacterium myungsuense TaxID=651823 RepID=UPI00363A1436
MNQLKTKANGAKRLVIAYMNIGAAENWRYYWNGNWILNDPVWIKKNYAGYENEFYIQFWNPEWQTIIYGNDKSYLKKIIDAGFDGVYLDNVEAYYFLYNK